MCLVSNSYNKNTFLEKWYVGGVPIKAVIPRMQMRSLSIRFGSTKITMLKELLPLPEKLGVDSNGMKNENK